MSEEIKKKEKNITDLVLARFNEMQQAKLLDIPKNYSANNALKSAWFVMQTIEAKDGDKKVPALTHCSNESIVNALFEMVVSGLNPMKKQCYFIPYAKKLTFMVSYQGNIALAKRYSGVLSVIPKVLHKDDIFKTEILSDGREVLLEHNQPIENLDKPITGGYAVIVDKQGNEHLTKQTLSMIKNSWAMGVAKGNGKPHNNFTDEMVKRTVANLACKPWINSSDDEAIISLEAEMDNTEDIEAEEVPTIKIETVAEPERTEPEQQQEAEDSPY